jgi:uncharacterized lipoprotein YddW (UPF0748 family)
MVRESLRSFVAAVVLAAVAGCTTVARTPQPEPPAAPREFRAAWVATVANIDWPSAKGLPVERQRAEMIAILDRAVALRLNAIILQVRPSADAIYPSALEPWTEYLTGEQGKAPEPAYDPLAEWIAEARQRGIEIHAWFNPYRARHAKAQAPEAATHVSRTQPELVRTYGKSLWLDPAEPRAAQLTIDVILDVVRRYDVDGVHIDDYFYPYPEGDLDFPDETPWRKYLASGGTLSRADWRRRNVDTLIERIHREVHREKPWVRFGISPFGIGRPGERPQGIEGFSQYDKLYADVETWVRNCWFDYLSPQLYWPREQAAQSFGVLLDYWIARNSCGRHIVPGLFTSRINDSPKTWSVDEIAGQIDLSRTRAGQVGHIHFSMAALTQNRAGISDVLANTRYASPALIPPSPWIAAVSPAPPGVKAARLAHGVRLELGAGAGKPVARYAVWTHSGGTWQFHVVPGTASTMELAVRALPVDRVVVSAVDRLGNESIRVAHDIAFSVAAVQDAIVPAADWGSTPADPARAKPHTIRHITLHHQGETYAKDRDPREYLRALQKWSRSARPWSDIPYHYVIDLQGRIYETRPLGIVGDTNTSYDTTGHALIQVVGNFDEVEPTPAQLEGVVQLMSVLAIRSGLTEKSIAGHRDHAPDTVCPGRNLYRYLENGWIQERVRQNLLAHREERP